MYRIMTMKHIMATVEVFPSSVTNLQTVRWRRKPRWLPVAKSKIFKVPPRTETPIEEREELKRLYNNYRTMMKSIRSYLHSQYNVKSVIVDTEAHEKEFLEDFNACSKINDEWNEQCRLLREARHVEGLEEAKNEAYRRIDERQQIRKKLLDSVEEIVRKEKDASKSFITPDNIDEAIEHALSNPVDYNFAIDIEGNVYHGRETQPNIKNVDKVAN